MGEPPHGEPGSQGLDIRRHEADGILVVTVAGEIDADTAPLLKSAVTRAIEDTPRGDRVLDLTAVTFLDSAGLAALVDATERAEERREALRIVVDANRPVIRPIEVTGLDDVLRLYHSVDDALDDTG
ncbi:STAS domain-containing protein [Allokutzneria albata]|uniref:Anti-sigma factor antagonist n=1 Tax=Allokutzneria albata TaxID=211114 RepID=A0A1G9SEG1_ALLAB|nr:STAS domain-containing protein [Allokutzneria albata]SDM33886.1 anti-sigma B factor antagonist [Allokutzneria albata]